MPGWIFPKRSRRKVLIPALYSKFAAVQPVRSSGTREYPKCRHLAETVHASFIFIDEVLPRPVGNAGYSGDCTATITPLYKS